MTEQRDDDDYTYTYVPNRPRTNEDLVRDLMNYNPTGALCQAMIVQAIREYVNTVVVAGPEKFDTGLLNGEAWVRCAAHIKATCDAFYGS